MGYRSPAQSVYGGRSPVLMDLHGLRASRKHRDHCNSQRHRGESRLQCQSRRIECRFVPITSSTAAVAFNEAIIAGLQQPAAGWSVAEFNGDGKLEMAVANLSTKLVSYFWGTGDGTFT